MTNKELQLIKGKILKCLTESFKKNQAIFDAEKGFAVFNSTNLNMVMDSVVKGLKFAQQELKLPKCNQCGRSFDKHETEADCKDFCCTACENGY